MSVIRFGGNGNNLSRVLTRGSVPVHPNNVSTRAAKDHLATPLLSIDHVYALKDRLGALLEATKFTGELWPGNYNWSERPTDSAAADRYVEVLNAMRDFKDDAHPDLLTAMAYQAGMLTVMMLHEIEYSTALDAPDRVKDYTFTVKCWDRAIEETLKDNNESEEIASIFCYRALANQMVIGWKEGLLSLADGRYVYDDIDKFTAQVSPIGGAIWGTLETTRQYKHALANPRDGESRQNVYDRVLRGAAGSLDEANRILASPTIEESKMEHTFPNLLSARADQAAAAEYVAAEDTQSDDYLFWDLCNTLEKAYREMIFAIRDQDPTRVGEIHVRIARLEDDVAGKLGQIDT